MVCLGKGFDIVVSDLVSNQGLAQKLPARGQVIAYMGAEDLAAQLLKLLLVGRRRQVCTERPFYSWFKFSQVQVTSTKHS